MLYKKAMRIPDFDLYMQTTPYDCGSACLKMIAKHYGKDLASSQLGDQDSSARRNLTLLELGYMAEAIGLRTLAVRIPPEKLEEMPLPCVAHWNNNHFVVIYRVEREQVFVADPMQGLMTYSRQDFLDGWIDPNKHKDYQGVLLLLEATPNFYQQEK